MDFPGQKEMGSNCVIYKYSEIKFTFAQNRTSPWVATITVFDTD